MRLYWIVLIILSLQVCVQVQTAASASMVQVFTGKNLTGESKLVNVSSCVSLKNDIFLGNIGSINTFGSCVMLSNDFDCTAHQGLGTLIQHTENFNLVYSDFHVGSLGPCRANCSSPSSYEKGRTGVMYGTKSGLRTFNTRTLATGACLLSRSAEGMEIERILLSHPLCIQLYESLACTGDSKMFQVSSKHKSPFNSDSDFAASDFKNNSYSFEVLPERWRRSRSISLCGFNCMGISTNGDAMVSTQPATTITGKPDVLSISSSIESTISQTGLTTLPPNTKISADGNLNLKVEFDVTERPAIQQHCSKIPENNNQSRFQAGQGHFAFCFILVLSFVTTIIAVEIGRRCKKKMNRKRSLISDFSLRTFHQ